LLKKVELFKTVLSGNREAIAKLSMKDLGKILVATLTGMSVEEFRAEVKKWLSTVNHPRHDRLYTELTYQPMQEAYGPTQGLPDTKVGAFTQSLYDEAKKQGWVVISMKSDWKRIFAFEE